MKNTVPTPAEETEKTLLVLLGALLVLSAAGFTKFMLWVL